MRSVGRLGRTFAPSHFVVLHIDWALHEYRDRIDYAHANDTERSLDRRHRNECPSAGTITDRRLADPRGRHFRRSL